MSCTLFTLTAEIASALLRRRGTTRTVTIIVVIIIIIIILILLLIIIITSSYEPTGSSVPTGTVTYPSIALWFFLHSFFLLDSPPSGSFGDNKFIEMSSALTTSFISEYFRRQAYHLKASTYRLLPLVWFARGRILPSPALPKKAKYGSLI
jgi:hypothetical protein